jgi:hydroxyacylglutathione hydrolase
MASILPHPVLEDLMLQIHMFPCLDDNYGFLIHDEASGLTATIDTPDADAIMTQAKARGWIVNEIWNTHWHPDHAGGNAAIEKAMGASSMGPQEVPDRIVPVTRVIAPGDTVSLGQSTARVLDVGGHTLGHIAFVFDADKVAFVGDALFALGCGRLFEGTAAQAWDSLSRLMELPDDTVVYCAHEYTQSNARFCATIEQDNVALVERIADIDAKRAVGTPTVPTTIGLERATNPFVRADMAGVRAALDMPDAPANEVFGEVRKRKDNFK